MARKPIAVFSMAFLDVMACGLGATVLFLLIVSAQVSKDSSRANRDLREEATRIEQTVLDGRKDLIRLRDTVEHKSRQDDSLAGEIARTRKQLADLQEKIPPNDNDSLAKKDSLEQLRSDVQRLEEGNRRLTESAAQAGSGTRVRSFVGVGNRQYLTGMKMGGQRVLILVDSSASMLARTYVNVVRYRAMSDDRKRSAPKWKQTVATVDWLTTQMDPGARFQIYTFNETAHSVIDGSDGTWLEVKDAGTLDRAVAALRKVVPDKGNSLMRAFEAAQKLLPAPDNIYLLTDGLPTQGKEPPDPPRPVRADQRATLFNQALKDLPGKVPINVILFPMDGDPDAAALYWQLAVRTRGSFLAPSRDWP